MPGVNVGTVSWKAFRFSRRRRRDRSVIKRVGDARALDSYRVSGTAF